ncbi:outer membrane beta-barrel protein [Siphonobacter sp. SORGH_AS_1065]|uniref:outer membrane beta-barrel protein n=1 Tax=Siphonobacter sp. SORGH_AS_1065 TaxID=3041795 RepID=UPI00277F8658|nr:outer membrane beta-barrel protein [Siphonobacter sp. SORGH_AS_1065]MDQ1086607.1 opacity protein-like surface antigen [Siphonobacter sp. SORGH_AS_1065]
MKRILPFLFSLILFIPTLTFAQTNPRSFVEVFGGWSGISGNFSQSNYANPRSGFARSGSVGGIQGAWFWGKHFGLGLSISQADYGVRTQPLAEGYREDFDVDQAIVTSKHYRLHSFLAGPYYSFAFNKFTLDLRGLAGFSTATLPLLRVALEDESVFTQNKSTATSFAYQLGAGVRWAFLPHFGLSLRADYASTKPDFSVSYTNINNTSGRMISSYHEKISGVNGTLGLSYQF